MTKRPATHSTRLSKRAPGDAPLAGATQAQTLAITSGKGGVGKSNVTINLAITLAQKGAKVCIFDADTNLANVNILMGLRPKYNIEHLLSGLKTLDDIMISGPAAVSIIPASSGLASLNDLDDVQQTRLIHALEELEQRFDYLLIDTAAGIGSNVTRFLRAAHSILLIISTEPTSLTDAFALLRVLKRGGYNQSTHVLVNMAINYGSGMEVFKRFEGAVRKYLDLPLSYAGYITDDIAVKEAIRQQCPVVLYRPDALATRCFFNLEKTLANHLPTITRSNKFSTFWKMLLTPKEDNIQAAQIDQMLSSKAQQPGEIRQGILNTISASALNNNDLLVIIQALISHIDHKKGTAINAIDKQLIGHNIHRLQKICSSDAPDTTLQQSRNTLARLAHSGASLEQQLDKLIVELEGFLK